MIRLLIGLLFLMIFLTGVIFTVYNPHPVTLNYIFGSQPIRLAILLLISLTIGALLGVLFSLNWAMKLAYQNRRLRKAQQQQNQTIEQLNLQLEATRRQS